MHYAMTWLVWPAELGSQGVPVGCIERISLAGSETYGRAEDYKQTVQGPSIDTHHTLALSRAA